MTAVQNQTYWILDKQQLETMTSARRQDIIDRLAAGGPMSIRALAEHIGGQPRLGHDSAGLVARTNWQSTRLR